jgi:uncharacterized protein YecE (DUF72 family)
MNRKPSEPNSASQPVFFIGTSGWTYDDWKGRFYPEDLPKKRWFEHYASQFSSVEVNATFYRTFKDETYHKWRERAPQHFGYVLKAPRLITHRKFLLDVEGDIQAFYSSCGLLEEKFEMILLQVAPNMPVEIERLHHALLAFPDPHKVAVEFRRPEWYTAETMDMLRQVGATICNVDSPQHTLTDHTTSNRAYLRLHGRLSWYAYNYSDEELRGVTLCTHELTRRGVDRVYIFFNNDYNANAPSNALVLRHFLDDLF